MRQRCIEIAAKNGVDLSGPEWRLARYHKEYVMARECGLPSHLSIWRFRFNELQTVGAASVQVLEVNGVVS